MTWRQAGKKKATPWQRQVVVSTESETIKGQETWVYWSLLFCVCFSKQMPSLGSLGLSFHWHPLSSVWQQQRIPREGSNCQRQSESSGNCCCSHFENHHTAKTRNDSTLQEKVSNSHAIQERRNHSNIPQVEISLSSQSVLNSNRYFITNYF